MQPSGFQVKKIQFKKIDFEQVESLGESSDIICYPSGNIVAKKSRENEYILQLNVNLSFRSGDAEAFYIKLIMISIVEVGSNFKESLLNNVVVIMSFYLNPVVEQIITIAKLPSLDFLLIDLAGLEIKVED